jgi:mannose-6-phosphate isomerase-like protein (cupin superfamily)
MNTKTPSIQEPGGGERIAVLGNTIDIKVSVAESAGKLTIAEYAIGGGFPGPPLHVHDFDELFYVLDGTLTVRAGDDVHELGAGGSAYVPGGAAHTFANQAGEPVRFLLACTPGGFEDYFRAVAEGADAETIAAVSAAYGYRVVGEPVAAV